MKSKSFYDEVYEVDHPYQYGGDAETFAPRNADQRQILERTFLQLGLTSTCSVLEVGCGMGYLASVHPGWTGVEYSATAVSRAKAEMGPQFPIYEGDAANLPFPDNSFDLVYSFATLEHVPAIERALESMGKVARQALLIAPAWNCRSWTVKKLQLRPYRALGIRDRIEKALIPLRDSVLYRALMAVPSRCERELRMAFSDRALPLHYKPLSPDFH